MASIERNPEQVNSPCDLSSGEIQALLGFPVFEPISRDEVLRAAAKIFGVPSHQLEQWRRFRASDAENVFVCLLEGLNGWHDSLEMSRTQNGGFMRMLNVRLCEVSSGKTDKGGRKKDKSGTELPALVDFGLDTVCAMIPGPMGRPWTYYRICRASEVQHRDNGRKRPYTPPLSTNKPSTKKPAAKASPSPAPAAAVAVGETERTSRKRKADTLFDMGNRAGGAIWL